MKMEFTGIPLIIMGLMVVVAGAIIFLIYKVDRSTTVDSFVTEITTSQQGTIDSQKRTIAMQEDINKKLLLIKEYMDNAKEYFDETITKRVAGLMIEKLQREPEATIGKFYKASIIIVYMEDQDGEFIKHGGIEFEEGSPSSLGMMWTRMP